MYATIDDMKARFEGHELKQLTDQEGVGIIKDAALTSALTDAENEINSYLAKAYILPISPVPPILLRFACDMARYNLWASKSDMPEVVRVRYAAAIAWLKSVSKGEVVLEAASTPAAQNPNTILTGSNAVAALRQRYEVF